MSVSNRARRAPRDTVALLGAAVCAVAPRAAAQAQTAVPALAAPPGAVRLPDGVRVYVLLDHAPAVEFARAAPDAPIRFTLRHTRVREPEWLAPGDTAPWASLRSRGENAELRIVAAPDVSVTWSLTPAPDPTATYLVIDLRRPALPVPPLSSARSPEPAAAVSAETPPPADATPAPVAPRESPPGVDNRRRFHVGVDGRAGFPFGVGVGIQYLPAPVFALRGWFETAWLLAAFGTGVAVMPLASTRGTHWSPVVTAGYVRAWFTDAGSDWIVGQVSRLAQTVDVRGLALDLLGLEAGGEFVSAGGFHFALTMGRIQQVGVSHGGNVVLSNWGAYTVRLEMGLRF